MSPHLFLGHSIAKSLLQLFSHADSCGHLFWSQVSRPTQQCVMTVSANASPMLNLFALVFASVMCLSHGWSLVTLQYTVFASHTQPR